MTVTGGTEDARAVTNGLRVFSRMTGIVDTRSMVLHPHTTTHASFAPDLNKRLGITAGLLRRSVGIESVDDLLVDLHGGLDRAPTRPSRSRVSNRSGKAAGRLPRGVRGPVGLEDVRAVTDHDRSHHTSRRAHHNSEPVQTPS
nr:PLP-dependent transferase [Cryobacterium sp. CAN_C3]